MSEARKAFYIIVYMSPVEIEHYSVSVKNELRVLIKALGLLLRRVQVSALFVACMSSYGHKSAFILGRYIGSKGSFKKPTRSTR